MEGMQSLFSAPQNMCDVGLQGAARVPEFIICVHHPSPEYASRIGFSLNVRCVLWFSQVATLDSVPGTSFPKTYPTLACPTFTVQKPTKSITPDQVTKLTQAITREAQRNRGSEMVFQVCRVLVLNCIVAKTSSTVLLPRSSHLPRNGSPQMLYHQWRLPDHWRSK